MKEYLRQNLGKSLLTSPFRIPPKAWALVPLFAIIAGVIGYPAGLFKIQMLQSKMAFLLPITLFVFPSLLEEFFFRGILIPRDVLSHGTAKAVKHAAFSTALFVLWHPFNALAFNHSAIPLFTNPWFLLIVTALGLTCSFGYVISRSIWVPVFIHWATVTVWVLFLGGRNLVLEM